MCGISIEVCAHLKRSYTPFAAKTLAGAYLCYSPTMPRCKLMVWFAWGGSVMNEAT